MPEIRAKEAWQNAREIAEKIAMEVQAINQKSEERMPPAMPFMQFVDQMTTEVMKLYYQKFIVIDRD